MSSALDMSLDDIIKSSKKSGSAAPGRGGASSDRGGRGSGGPARRNQNRLPRTAPYAVVTAAAKAPNTAWQHDMFVDQGFGGGFQGVATGASAIETGTKLYVSNLDYGVSNEDIKELFSEVGDLKRHAIHYDRSGRSKGTAEVVFSRRMDALAAVKRYNNVQLDGKPMRIEIVGTNLVTPVVQAAPNGSFSAPNAKFRNLNGLPRGGPGRGAAFAHGRGGSGGRRSGQVRGRGRGRGGKLSAEDLDADLEKYHSEAMETSSGHTISISTSF